MLSDTVMNIISVKIFRINNTLELLVLVLFDPLRSAEPPIN